MKYSSAAALLALSMTASAQPTAPHDRRATPTIYTCGDSTMAKDGAANGATDGWGQYLYNYTTIPVVNKAMAGRSARSYYEEGRFDRVAELVVPGDIVVLEFGHNDGGTPVTADNNRAACPGAGEETCISSLDGSTVYTFAYYMNKAAKLFVSKGASVILSTMTPSNPWETGKFVYGPPRFVEYQRTVAQALNSPSVTYVDHFNAVDLAFMWAGATTVDWIFAIDHTHMAPWGADLAAKAFAQAIATSMNGTTSMKDYIIADHPWVY